ncbi:MAG TPA: response regulator transcription factor [Opitutaceae bacterium]|nr:response regulator transcription factor [Opitutaceae bacterium]
MNATRVFIVDDHPLVREWLGNLLRLETDIQVVGAAGDPATALANMSAQPPDIAVVDLSFQRGSGLDLIKDLRSQLPDVRIIVLSMHEEMTDLERSFRAGASGYVMKRESTSQIVEAIRQVRAGRMFANPAVLGELTARLVGRPASRGADAIELLSDRELEVFRRLGEGRSTRDIAEALGVSLKTIQTYCARIKEKLGLDDGQELARVAFHWHEHRPEAED